MVASLEIIFKIIFIIILKSPRREPTVAEISALKGHSLYMMNYKFNFEGEARPCTVILNTDPTPAPPLRWEGSR